MAPLARTALADRRWPMSAQRPRPAPGAAGRRRPGRRGVRWPAVAVLAVLAGLLVALTPSNARADADPASDYLLVAPAFYPYQPPTSPTIRKALEGQLAALKAKGLNLKVAIVNDPTDLGGVSNLWNMPAAYAKFLDSEISFNKKQPLLVVMPAGFGTAAVGTPGALSGLVADGAHGADGLSRSAISAVARLAQDSGRPLPVITIPAVGGSPGGGGGGTSPLLTFGAPVILVVLVAAAAAARRRHSTGGEDHGSGPSGPRSTAPDRAASPHGGTGA